MDTKHNETSRASYYVSYNTYIGSWSAHKLLFSECCSRLDGKCTADEKVTPRPLRSSACQSYLPLRQL